MEVSKQVATDSGIGVKEWGIEGDPVDTNMQQGHLLTFTKAQVVLKAIALARTVAGA
jgi:hypothetical protein